MYRARADPGLFCQVFLPAGRRAKNSLAVKRRPVSYYKQEGRPDPAAGPGSLIPSERNAPMIRTVSGDPAVFVVLTQTGTILSQILRVVTGDAYNHASISVDGSLRTLYSFGRRHPYNPVWGGFVQESPVSGTFARFADTRAKVLRVPVTQQQYEQIKQHLEQMYRHRQRYHYNYLGLLLAFFHLAYQKEDCFYCSEFVKDVLVRYEVTEKDAFGKIVKPMELMELSGSREIYSGILSEYAASVCPQ